jgi:hypothetical protein
MYSASLLNFQQVLRCIFENLRCDDTSAILCMSAVCVGQLQTPGWTVCIVLVRQIVFALDWLRSDTADHAPKQTRSLGSGGSLGDSCGARHGQASHAKIIPIFWLARACGATFDQFLLRISAEAATEMLR